MYVTRMPNKTKDPKFVLDTFCSLSLDSIQSTENICALSLMLVRKRFLWGLTVSTLSKVL